MKKLRQIQKIPFLIDEEHGNGSMKDTGKLYLRRIIISGLLSFILLFIIINTLPKTILSVPSLLEYSIIVSLVLFLIILLVRYFVILFLAYLYINEYTFLEENSFSPFVSLIVPAFNEAKILKQSLQSLLDLNYRNYEIIIVNDGSTDDTKEIAESFVGYRNGKFNPIKISLINKRNNGKASALNVGIQYSTAEFVLCMDGDSQLSPDSLKRAVRHFKDHSIGAVAGNVKVLNRKRFLTDLQALEYIEGLNMARSAQSFVHAVNIIPGPIGLFRKSGIIQSIRKHKKQLVNPTINFRNTVILWSMFYEALIWPPMNIAAHLFFIIAALVFGI